jgi:excisionase family DNA binding protein
MSEPLTLSIREAARLLSISHWSVRRWIRLGQLPAVRLGRRVVVEPASLQRLIEQGRVGSDRTIHNLSKPGV